MRNALEREREIADLYARFDDLTSAEMKRLTELDAIGVLCHLVKDAGLTMRLHGEPIETDALRSHCETLAVERIVNAVVDDTHAGCERCNGAGWLWPHEVGDHETDQRYPCPGVEPTD